MSDDFIEERDAIEEEYEIDEELEPEMQAWIQGWNKAGRYEKKEKQSEDFDEEY